MDNKEFENESMSNPLVQELTALLGDNSVKLPYIEKDKILMSPGVWNQKMYSAEEIKKAFANTDWTNKQNKFLFYDHEDTKASEWVGEITNQRVTEEGVLMADTIYYDPILAIKLSYGKPKIGISPKVRGEDRENHMVDFVYENFSVVVNPAVKTAWINNSDGNKPTGTEDLNLSKDEVKSMEEQEKKPVEENKTDEVKENQDVELSSFVEFYKQEKAKNPAFSMKEVCNAFISKDEDSKKEDKEEDKKEEQKPEMPEEMPYKEEMKSEDVKPETDVLSEMKKENEELKKVVQTMSDNMKKIAEKLEAPERVAVKGSAVNELASKQDSDIAMMNYLKGI